jgi:hypothetical protein
MKFEKGEVVVFQPDSAHSIYHAFCSLHTVNRVLGDVVIVKHGTLSLERTHKFPFQIGDEVQHIMSGKAGTIREISPNGIIRLNTVVDDWLYFRQTRQDKIKHILRDI